MINDYEADEVVEELFESLMSRYQNNLKQGIDFVFDYVYLL